MTDQTIQNFLTILKGKPISDWKFPELEEFMEEIPVLYRYSDDKEACATLKSIYHRIVDYFKEKRGFTVYQKNFLDRIKK